MRATVPRPSAPAIALNVVVATAAIALDQSLPGYRPVAGFPVYQIGRVRHPWPRNFVGKGVREPLSRGENNIEAKGSATAPGALLEGAAQFGPMSRPMTAEESAAFEGKYGYKLSSFRVAVDALAVYVNKTIQSPARRFLRSAESSRQIVRLPAASTSERGATLA